MDPRNGQEFYFQRKNAKSSKPVSKKRKRNMSTPLPLPKPKPIKKPLEDRLAKDESVYQSNNLNIFDTEDDIEQVVPTINYGSVNVVELRQEIARHSGRINHRLNKAALSKIVYTMREIDRNYGIPNPAQDLTTRSKIQIPNRCVYINDDDSDIYSSVDENYHRDGVGENSEQPGDSIVQALNGDVRELSRIYPSTDFLDTMLGKIPFLRKLDKNDGIKKSINDALNSARKQPASAVEQTPLNSQFSPIGDPDNRLTMLESQLELERSSPMIESETQLAAAFTNPLIENTETPTTQSLYFSPSQRIRNGVSGFSLSEPKKKRIKQTDLKDVSCTIFLLLLFSYKVYLCHKIVVLILTFKYRRICFYFIFLF